MKRLFIFALICLFWCCQARVASAAPPNIVLIMADDLGYECIGANGGTSYKTPVLDRLEATGVRFEHCYSQPICTPSRVKLMTGIANVRNYVAFGKLEESQTTFANLLKKAGYATCIVGKWQLGRKANLPKHFGFDEHCLWQLLRLPSRYPNPGLEINGKPVDYTSGEYGPDVVTGFACDFIKRHRDTPFLLYYPMILTHCPFEPTPDSKDWNPKSKGSKTYKGKPKYFGDMVSYMDKTIGTLLEQLDAVGVRENTLVIFIGDNGTDKPIVSMMGDRKVAGEKGKMTDGGTRVPLIVNWLGKTPKGETCRDLVDFSDFLPTMCEVAGVKVPTSLAIDGQSFLPQIRGNAETARAWIYCWYARNGGAKGREFARNQRYKLYRTGELFDIQNDVLEKSPLKKSTLSNSVKRINQSLQSALNQFSDARPEKFTNWKKNNTKKKRNKKSKKQKLDTSKSANKVSQFN